MWYCAPFKSYYPHRNNPEVKAALQRIEEKMQDEEEEFECQKVMDAYLNFNTDEDVLFLNRILGVREEDVISYPIEKTTKIFTQRLYDNLIMKNQIITKNDLTLLLHEIKYFYVSLNHALIRCDEYDLINEVYSTNRIFVAVSLDVVLSYLTDLYKEAIKSVVDSKGKDQTFVNLKLSTTDIETIIGFIHEQTKESYPRTLMADKIFYLYQFMLLFAFKTQNAKDFKNILDAFWSIVKEVKKDHLQVYNYDGFALFQDVYKVFHYVDYFTKIPDQIEESLLENYEIQYALKGYSYDEMVKMIKKIRLL